jgi:hypothetical protein
MGGTGHFFWSWPNACNLLQDTLPLVILAQAKGADPLIAGGYGRFPLTVQGSNHEQTTRHYGPPAPKRDRS